MMIYYILDSMSLAGTAQQGKGMRMTNNQRLDALAGMLSAACLVHCLMLPLLAAALPALSALAELPEGVHLILLLMAVPVSLLGLGRGWQVHRRVGPFAVGLGGLSLLGAGVLVHDLETSLTVAGALLLAAAHAANWLARDHRCGD